MVRQAAFKYSRLAKISIRRVVSHKIVEMDSIFFPPIIFKKKEFDREKKDLLKCPASVPKLLSI